MHRQIAEHKLQPHDPVALLLDSETRMQAKNSDEESRVRKIRGNGEIRRLRPTGSERAGRILLTIGSGLLLLVAHTSSVAQTKPEAAPAAAAERGKYIVEHFAMCIQCHTPRDDNGDLLLSQYLQGAPVPVKPPPYPNINWALKAPAIAGLIGYTKEEGVRLLTEGITRDGRVPNPPMPPFRMTRSDAEAVVDYLKSLQ